MSLRQGGGPLLCIVNLTYQFNAVTARSTDRSRLLSRKTLAESLRLGNLLLASLLHGDACGGNNRGAMMAFVFKCCQTRSSQARTAHVEQLVKEVCTWIVGGEENTNRLVDFRQLNKPRSISTTLNLLLHPPQDQTSAIITQALSSILHHLQSKHHNHGLHQELCREQDEQGRSARQRHRG